MKVEQFKEFRNVKSIENYHNFTCVPLRFAILNTHTFHEDETVTVLSVIT
jgi:hypothetical protein